MTPREPFPVYRRRVMAQMDAYLDRCRRERKAREWAAEPLTLPGVDVERAAIAEEAPA